MPQHTDLMAALRPHLPLHGARLDFLARFVLALLKVSSVSLARVSTALNGSVNRASNERRCARFLAGFDLAQELVARYVLGFLPPGELVLTLDRTEHHLGRTPVNVLTLGVAHGGLAFPLAWTCLGKPGNSSTAERVALLERVLKLVPPERLLALTADREFVGERWFAFLHEKRVPFVIRIKANTLVRYRDLCAPASLWFHRFAPGDTGQLKRPCRLLGQRVHLVAQRLADGTFLLLAASRKPRSALATYARRWDVECLFGAYKSRGFDLEATHLTRPERVERLFGLLAIALVWAQRIGQFASERVPIPVKKHGRPLFSTFRYGLDHLRQLLLANGSKNLDWHEALRVLSGT